MAQFLLPSPVNFQVTPSQVNYDSLVQKMYQPKRALMYPRSPYAARQLLKTHSRATLEGLGFSYYDLLAQAGLETCDPKDTACVDRNVQRQNAVEDLWVSEYMTHPETASLPAPQIAVDVATSPQAVQSFKANLPQTEAEISAGGQVYSVPQLEQTYLPPPAPAVPVKPNQSVPPTTPLIPMQTGFQSTAEALAQQAAANQAVQQPSGTAVVLADRLQQPGKILGMDQKTFLLVAGVGAVLLFLGAKK